MALPDRWWFSYDNLIDAAAISADTEVSSLPATNVADRLAYRIWRSQSNTPKLWIDFKSVRTWQSLILLFPAHRDPSSSAALEIDPTDQITVSASSVSQTGFELLNDTVNSNVNKVRGYFVYVASAPVTSRYVQLTITATSRAVANYIDAGYLHIGPVFQPNANFNRGATVSFQEESLINISPTSGSTYSESRGRILQFNGVGGLIDESERASWETMIEQSGLTAPIAFGTHTTGDLSRKAFIARFQSPVQLQAGQSKRVSARVQLKENR